MYSSEAAAMRKWIFGLGALLAAAAFALPYQPLTVFEVEPMTQAAVQDSSSEFTTLAHATKWLNSSPLTPAALRGRVVLVNFWTYTCINWQRQLPYVRAWAEKYKDQGLMVIGVHTPEFEFEKNLDNVRRFTDALAVSYPVAVDSDYSIWNGFSNRYWPALYFIDATGRLRHTQFGEGGYDQSERVIQQLLKEAGTPSVDKSLVSVSAAGSQAEADWSNLKSPETYLGSDRGENFASEGQTLNAPMVYAVPSPLRLNHWALSGNWTIRPQYAALNGTNGRVAFRFHARDLHLVMGPSEQGKSVRIRVRIDGQSPGNAHGTDIDADGNGTLDGQRLYQLIRQQHPIADRTFEIEFLDPGAAVFVFTFG
jgi:thiol-disulfide isomerase/thioredoxin